MNTGLILAGIILMVLVAISEHSRLCLSCTDMKEGELCQHIVSCPDNEVCFLQKYTTSLGERRYDVGCINNMMCLSNYSAPTLGRRTNDHSHILCHECCNNTRLCNMDLTCSHVNNVQGQSCLSCSDVDMPSACNSTISCGTNEVCYTHLYETESKRHLYDLGCKPSFLCPGSNLNPFGRRSSEGRHHLCATCCSMSNNCNVNSSCTQYFPTECEYIHSDVSGVYSIYPGNQNTPVDAYCIMEKDKKWTVIQKRYNGTVDFFRTWDEYKVGFGSATGEYWLGNDNIHLISTDGEHELSVMLLLNSTYKTYANYTEFNLGDEQSQYYLNVTGYHGDAGDGLSVGGSHGGNNDMFSTKDRDNDGAGRHFSCAQTRKGGWWYGYCADSGINDVFKSGKLSWENHYNVYSSVMMIRKT